MGARQHTGFTGILLACFCVACFVVGFSLTTLFTNPPQDTNPPATNPIVEEQQAENSSEDFTKAQSEPEDPAPTTTTPVPDPDPNAAGTVRYVDRIELPPYADFLYRWLEEATDFDGQDDWLIEDRYFAPNPQESTDGIETPGTIIALDDDYAVSLGAVDDSNSDEVSSYIGTAWYAFDQDHPEVFWLDNTFWLGAVTLGDGTYCPFLKLTNQDWQMRSEDFRSRDAIAQGIATRDAQVAAILDEAQVAGDDGATLRNFNDWLTAHNGYSTKFVNEGSALPYSATSLCALVGNSGEQGPICEGYSRAFKVLCDRAGIPCALSSGVAEGNAGSGPHMWNIVQADGQWYAVDVTWNDPNASDGPVSGLERDDYTLVGSGSVVDGRTFSDSHQLESVGPEGTPNLTNEPALSETAYVW